MIDPKTYKFVEPPKHNTKITFGSDTSTFLQFYSKRIPNIFQRWLTYKLLGIKIEKL